MRSLKERLLSRKFWMAISTFALGILLIFGKDQYADRITGCIMVIADTIIYILSESIIDSENKKEVKNEE